VKRRVRGRARGEGEVEVGMEAREERVGFRVMGGRAGRKKGRGAKRID